MNEEKQEEKKEESFFKETLKFAVITLIIVLPIRIFIAEPFIVSGPSMQPTFQNGDYLIVDRISYKIEDPKRGEVVIFRYPIDKTKYFIKRIVGLPGETVKIDGSTVTIFNDKHKDGFILYQNYVEQNLAENETRVLGEEEYFVMGDNRPKSSDSRSWGPVSKNLIIGRAMLRLFPLSKINVFPGNHSEENLD